MQRPRVLCTVDLKLAPGVRLGSSIGSILDCYHSPQAGECEGVRQAFASMERRVAERCQDDGRALGNRILAFIKSNSVPLDDQEKRRIYNLGKDLAEGRCSSI